MCHVTEKPAVCHVTEKPVLCPENSLTVIKQ